MLRHVELMMSSAGYSADSTSSCEDQKLGRPSAHDEQYTNKDSRNKALRLGRYVTKHRCCSQYPLSGTAGSDLVTTLPSSEVLITSRMAQKHFCSLGRTATPSGKRIATEAHRQMATACRVFGFGPLYFDS